MQKFINRHLRKILNILWPVFSTEERWRYIQKKPVAVQNKLWNWIRNTLRKDSSARLSVVIPYQGQCRKGRPRTSWRRTQHEEQTVGNIWKQV
jgi:hypothetical protein